MRAHGQILPADGQSVFYTAKVGRNVELFRVTLDGNSEQLGDTAAVTMHFHPASSPDRKWGLLAGDGTVGNLHLRKRGPPGLCHWGQQAYLRTKCHSSDTLPPGVERRPRCAVRG